MNEQNGQSRRGRPLSRAEWQASQQRLRYRQAFSDSPAKEKTPTQTTKKQPMTYDDYIRSLASSEKLFEVEEIPFGERFRKFTDVLSEFASRLKTALWRRIRSYSVTLLAFIRSHRPEAVNKQLKPVIRTYKQLEKRFGARTLMVAGSLGAIFILAGFSVILTKSQLSKPDKGGNGEVQGVSDAPKPTFDVVESETRDENTKVAFDPQLGVASFQDKVGDLPVVISQQPLAEEQRKNQNEFLNEVSVNLRTTGSIETDKGTVHFTIPTQKKNDTVQVIIFIYKDLLIFVRADGTLEPDQIKAYVDGLK